MKLFRITILAILAFTLIACGGAEERKAVYMDKAKSSIAAGDLEKARIELKNVMQIDPKDSSAHYLLGEIYEQQKDYRKAFANYRKAEELNPDLLENKARLGRLYLILANDKEEVQSRIDYILTKDPINSEGLLLKAALLVRDNKESEAIQIGRQVLARDSANVDAVSFIAVMYIKNKKINEAAKVLNSAIKVKPDNDVLNNLLAKVYKQTKDYDKAEIIYKKFLEKYPDDAASYVRLAALYNVMEDKDKAERQLRLSIENDPKDVERYLTLVKYISQIKGKDAAVNELKIAVEEQEGIGKLRIALGEILLLNGDKKEAKDVYVKAASDFSEELTGMEARIALSSLYFNEGDVDRAEKVVDEAMVISPKNPKINFIRARLAILAKDPEKAIISLRTVIKETPDNIDAYFTLVNAYALDNDSDQIADTLNTAYENNRSNPAALLKLSKYYLGRDPKKAEKVIDSYNSLRDSDYEGMSIKAVVLNGYNGKDALVLAEKIIKEYPDKPNGYLQSIPFLAKQGDIDTAISLLEKGYAKVKDNRKILELLTRLQLQKKQFGIVEERIVSELTSSPDDSSLKLLLAKVYLASGKWQKAEVLLGDIIKAKPSLEEPYILLSHVYRNNNDSDSNKAILIKGVENVVKSYSIPLKLAALYEEDHDFKKAIAVYRETYEVQKENMVVANNLASLLSDYSDDKNDLDVIKSLSEKLEKNGRPVFFDTIGWVHYRLGDLEKAIDYLLKSAEKSPEINVFNYHLGMAYKMSGDKAKAKVYLEKSLANGKEFKEKDLAKAALKDL